DSHLWASLVPLEPHPNRHRIDLWRLTPIRSLGRNPALNTIILPGSHISGEHAIIYWNNEDGKSSEINLLDVSAGGTWVQGEKVGYQNTRQLKDLDEIGFGAPVRVTEGDGVFDFRYIFRDLSLPRVKLDDLFVKGKRVGKGTYGEVYQALDKATNKLVAVKKIKYRVRDPREPRAESSLEQITALQTIQHPHVIQLFRVIHGHRTPDIYLVLDWVEGNLLDYIRRSTQSDRCLPENICREIMFQLCHAMAYMHALGIVHRDLKPDNILIDPDMSRKPFIKVADFGLVKIQKNMAEPQLIKTLCGSPVYIAPEVDDPASPGYDHVADSWSVGIIFFAMLTGTEPFVTKRRLSDNRIPDMRWELLPPVVSPEGQDVLRRLLQVDPQRRISPRAVFDHRWMRTHQKMHPNQMYPALP
ncbi:kinase-like domain-containing protein, partial [Mycena crocata]